MDYIFSQHRIGEAPISSFIKPIIYWIDGIILHYLNVSIFPTVQYNARFSFSNWKFCKNVLKFEFYENIDQN